ncbi:hypothetical protein ACIPUD_38780 [Bradyrhizobium sp. CAR08]
MVPVESIDANINDNCAQFKPIIPGLARHTPRQRRKFRRFDRGLRTSILIAAPQSLELSGDEPVIRIDRIILPARPIHLVSSPPTSVFDLPLFIAVLLALCLKDGQRRFHSKRLQAVKNLLGNGSVKRIPPKPTQLLTALAPNGPRQT